MTYSIVARDPQTGLLGVAVASRVLAVGARCAFARAKAGAISSQARANPYLALDALPLLERGASAQQTLEDVLARDDGRADRQCHMVDAEGRAAAWTGDRCQPWCGHVVGESKGGGWSVAGNLLTGPGVIDAVVEAYTASARRSFAERLIAALAAGDAAGGDLRGRQSAALLIVGLEGYPEIDLRIDDYRDPVGELTRLLGVFRIQMIELVRKRSVRRAGDCILDEGLTG